MESALAFLAGMVFMAVLFIGGAFLVSRFVPDDEPEWTREAQQGMTGSPFPVGPAIAGTAIDQADTGTYRGISVGTPFYGTGVSIDPKDGD